MGSDVGAPGSSEPLAEGFIEKVSSAFGTHYISRGDWSEPATATFFGAPSLWWPIKREWLLATPTDGTSTYVGGPARVIEAIEAVASLETLRLAATDLVVH